MMFLSVGVDLFRLFSRSFSGVKNHDRKLQNSKTSYWKILVSTDDSSQNFVVFFCILLLYVFFIFGVQTPVFFGVNPIVGVLHIPHIPIYIYPFHKDSHHQRWDEFIHNIRS